MKDEKLLKKALSGSKNVSFDEFVKLIRAFGFELDRVRGSHHIFKHKGTIELINIQDVNGKVKPYQIKQFLAIVENNNLKMEKKDE